MKIELYFDFIKRVLTDNLSEQLRHRFFEDPYSISESEVISELKKPVDYNSLVGNFWPKRAHTMIGLKRLDNLQFCVEDVLKNKIDGDLIETGVWRGGTTIFMRLLLKGLGIKNKTVYVSDSFEGLPKPDVEKYPEDKGDIHYTYDELKVSLDEVKNNFNEYGVLDENVKFLKGWFADTLKNPPFKKLCILRLDGDMYGSTWVVLENLYDKLSEGGYVIIDDYSIRGCRHAINDFRLKNNIQDPIQPIDWTGVFWKKNDNSTFSKLTSQFSQAALDALIFIYSQRKDLQTAFPAVAQGEYSSLINWASNVTSKNFNDIDYDYLVLFKDWFQNHVSI